MNETIHAYITSLLKSNHPRLDAITLEQDARDDVQPNIGLEVGKLLGILIQAVQARRVLEFGTALGYSTVCLAQALESTGGHLTAVEFNEKLFRETQANVEAAGLLHRVTLIHGDAQAFAETLEGPFDMILQDSDKALYPEMLERCIQLVRPLGLIVADDALFPAMPVPERFSTPLKAYNELVFNDPRLDSTLLPIGDGVLISVKRAG